MAKSTSKSTSPVAPAATSITSLENIIKAALFTPGPHGWGLPILLWGQVGIAKTSLIEAIARKWGLAFNSLVGSIIEPMDVAGMQLPDEQNHRMVQYPAHWVSRANANQGHVQLLDELTTCPRAVQGAMLKLVFERKAGEVALHRRVRFLAAANPMDQAANATDIETPLANRFGHIEAGAPEVDVWSDWLLGGADYDADPADPSKALEEEKRVVALWDSTFSRAAAVVASFLRTRGSLFNDQPSAGDPKASLAFPTPRTWELATRALAAADVHGLSPDERATLVAAFVGPGPASEYLAYARQTDLPDPEALLDGRMIWRHQSNRADRTFAVLSSITALLVRQKGSRPMDEFSKDEAFIKRLRQGWKICMEVARAEAADIAYPALQRMIKAELDYRCDKTGLMQYAADIHPIASKIGGSVGR